MAGIAQWQPKAENYEHGTRMRYATGCRCVPCRSAHARYQSFSRARVKRGDGNPVVDASKARAHLIELSQKGVGYKQAADFAGVARSAVQRIYSGVQPRARRETVRAILTVTTEARADGALIDARQTWRRVEYLQARGWAKARIAYVLGNEQGALQLGKKRVTVRNARKVLELYNQERTKERNEL